ncbi:MAG: sulfurtransferase complex subunit TusB [Methanosarcina sp.]
MEKKQGNVFLLTKSPATVRAELCIKLALRSGNARIYLTADGVYHLLSGIEDLQNCKIYACRDDLEARGIRPGKKVVVPDDFYADLIKDLMETCRHNYTF